MYNNYYKMFLINLVIHSSEVVYNQPGYHMMFFRKQSCKYCDWKAIFLFLIFIQFLLLSVLAGENIMTDIVLVWKQIYQCQIQNNSNYWHEKWLHSSRACMFLHYKYP